jgi:hypothetical protein
MLKRLVGVKPLRVTAVQRVLLLAVVALGVTAGALVGSPADRAEAHEQGCSHPIYVCRLK